MSKITEESKVNCEAPKVFRFRTWHLFYLTALIAVGLFVAGVYSLVISSIVLTAWWTWYRAEARRMVLIIAVLVAIMIGMLLPAIQITRGGAPGWLLSANNMRQCILAMHNYESSLGHCPPVWQEDKAGKPMHSWRVLILPFLEEDRLYKQYNFDEPWDGPNNSKLVGQMPEVYRIPYGDWSTNETIYKLVLDQGSFFTAGEGRPLSDAVDGTATTIVLLEDKANPVNWMKPDGISIEQAVAGYLNRDACYCGQAETNYSKGIFFRNVATLDGATYRISPDVDPDLLRAAMRSDDGVSPDLSKLSCETFAYKPGGFVALGFYVVLLVLPFWLLRKRNAVKAATRCF